MKSTPISTGHQSQMAAPPTLSNGDENTVKIAAVIEVIANPSANDVNDPSVRRSVCLCPNGWRSQVSRSREAPRRHHLAAGAADRGREAAQPARGLLVIDRVAALADEHEVGLQLRLRGQRLVGAARQPPLGDRAIDRV